MDEKDLTTRDPAKLAQSGLHVAPVMHGKGGESGAKATIGKRKFLGYTSYDRCCAQATLACHDLRWLESHDLSIRGLVVSSSGTDVKDPVGISEGSCDPRM